MIIRIPGRIDNRYLMENDELRLKSNLVEGKDYVIISEPLWLSLHRIYGGNPAISRRVIKTKNNNLELELYPLLLHIHRYNQNGVKQLCDQLLSSKVQTVCKIKNRVCQILDVDPNRSRLMLMDSISNTVIPLTDEQKTLEDLELCEEAFLLLDVANSRGKFHNPSHIASNSHSDNNSHGIVGLDNLGNTCYLNSALQCIFHTHLLRDYFLSNEYSNHINRNSISGYNGDLAVGLARLMQCVWKEQYLLLAPRSFFSILKSGHQEYQGNRQHDAQEILQLILDVSYNYSNKIIACHSTTTYHLTCFIILPHI